MVVSWLIGALNALIEGAASSLTAFALGVKLKHAAAIAGVSAIVGFGKWVAQHPLVPPGNGGSSPTPPAPQAPVSPSVQAVQSVAEQLLNKKL
jgi:hypothetical protein